jgi:DNA-binding GntR family transcriptional regulator
MTRYISKKSTDDHDAQLKRPSLRSAVQNRLEEAILRGELKDGQQLIETDIAKWLGVSRGLVRESFRELEKTGIVTHNPYRGTFVKSLTADRVRELYTLRTKLEEYAIQLAILNICDEDIEELSELLELMRRTAEEGNSGELIELDLQFHKNLYSLSGHEMLKETLNNLSRQTHLFIMATKSVYSVFPTLKDAADSHEPILKALKARDSQKACLEIQAHIFDVGTRLYELLREKEQQAELSEEK